MAGPYLSTRLMAYSAAALFAAGAFLGFVEGFIPGGPPLSLIPVLAAVPFALFLLTWGPHLPRRVLAPLGPIGVALIAVAVATTPGAGDGAVLYIGPVVWTAFFFGRRGAITIVACIGVAHAAALAALPTADGYADRWVDVVVSVSVVAVVVQALARENSALLGRIAAEARTDHLTGVLNRRGFYEIASRCVAQARRDESSVAVAMFDLDFFKKVNDEWGHEVGDRVLAYLAATLVIHSRDVDVVARVGGEEFVVLLPRCTADDAEDFTRRVRAALAEPLRTDLPVAKVSAGVSASIAPPNIALLLHRADEALYAAKGAGRDRTVIYQPDGADHVSPVAIPERQ